MSQTQVTVRKLDEHGQETWRYTGQVVARGPDWIRLEARFNRPDLPFHGILLRENDRFVETFYANRWYNIFAVHDRDSDALKAWYCNVGRPAAISESEVSYQDLALDLLVFPDGRQLVLDEEEYARLQLSEADRRQCAAALAELQRRAAAQDLPAG